MLAAGPAQAGLERFPAPGCLAVQLAAQSEGIASAWQGSFNGGKGDDMSGNENLSAAGHFGRQLKKARLARGWSLDDLSATTGINAGHLSRVENNRRPPTASLAEACDGAFPERNGWFSDWYRESRSWSEVPAAFRDWNELEDSAPSLAIWQPGIIDGLLQTEGYARALLSTSPGVTDELVAARLAGRMERQRRVLLRDDPPQVLFLLDELALYRCVGSATVMAEQLRHLLSVAAMPSVTLQAVPPVAHAANASAFMIAGDAAYAEHVAGGFTYTEPARVSSMVRKFDSLRGECRRVSETTAIIKELCDKWMTGVSPLGVTPMAVNA